MAVTNNDNYAEKMRILSLHGMNKQAWNRYSKKGSWYYEIVAPGFKYNLTDIASSLGIWQLKKCNLLCKKRAKIAEEYSKAFKNIKELELLVQKDYGSNAWHLYVIKLNLEKLKIDRDSFVRQLKRKNIGASVHFIPLHLQPYWKNIYNLKAIDFPAASSSYKKIVSLPIFPSMARKDTNDVIFAVKDIINKWKI